MISCTVALGSWVLFVCLFVCSFFEHCMELVGDVSAGISTPSEDWQLSSKFVLQPIPNWWAVTVASVRSDLTSFLHGLLLTHYTEFSKSANSFNVRFRIVSDDQLVNQSHLISCTRLIIALLTSMEAVMVHLVSHRTAQETCENFHFHLTVHCCHSVIKIWFTFRACFSFAVSGRWLAWVVNAQSLDSHIKERNLQRKSVCRYVFFLRKRSWSEPGVNKAIVSNYTYGNILFFLLSV